MLSNWFSPKVGRIMACLDTYRDVVKDHARVRSGEPILDASMGNASVVVETLFATAQEQVSILTGRLSPRVYGRDRVVTEAKLYLLVSHKNRLRILLESDSKIDRQRNPFLIACAGFPNVELRVVPARAQERYDFHFVVVDSESYHLRHDRTRPFATVQFGDVEGAQNLNRIFDILWEDSDPIAMPPDCNSVLPSRKIDAPAALAEGCRPLADVDCGRPRQPA